MISRFSTIIGKALPPVTGWPLMGAQIAALGMLLTFLSVFAAPVLAERGLPPAPTGAASDPLAVVTFTDLRYTSNNLDGGEKRSVLSIEGAYVFHPRFKLTYDANYWRTDTTGTDQTGWADFRIRPIYYPKTRRWRNLVYRTAVGLDLRIDAGNSDRGIGDGTDQLGAFAGLQLLFNRKTRMSVIGGYRKSFNNATGRKSEQTELNIAGVRSISAIRSWIAANLLFLVNHENDNASTTAANLQAGYQFTKRIGMHVDSLFPISGTDLNDYSARFTLRILY